jgi:hypothetical protein
MTLATDLLRGMSLCLRGDARMPSVCITRPCPDLDQLDAAFGSVSVPFAGTRDLHIGAEADLSEWQWEHELDDVLSA